MTYDRRQPLIGSSPLLMDVIEQVSSLAQLNKPVLVLGERGTGKELIAERLHYLSRRWDQPFLKLNCAAMSETLLESELFGHEAGAFTGATRRHQGRFERADGGTLFLDELATCSMRVQEQLLRVIEYGEFERVGGQQTQRVDVRLIAATNENLPEKAAEGEFRADLLDRLAFDVVNLPPLRYRPEDIPELAEHFATRMCLELERAYFPGFSELALSQLCEYAWPGNVRELKNVVERSVYRSSDAEDEPVSTVVLNPFQTPWLSSVTDSAVAARVDAPVDGVQQSASLIAAAGAEELKQIEGSLPERVLAVEKHWLEGALAQHRYNQRRTAEALGITYHQLRAYLRKHQMLPLKQYLAAQDDLRG